MNPSSEVAATLRIFHQGRDEGSRVLLWQDGAVQLIPSDALRGKVTRISERADAGLLKWGTSLVVGFGAIGGLLVLREKRGWGFFLFLLSLLAGLFGFGARKAARVLPKLLTGRTAAEDISVEQDEGGNVVFTRRGVPPLKLRLAPEQYDAEEARAFLQIWRRFSGATGL